MTLSERRLTKVHFKAQDAVALYYPHTSGGPTGWDPVYEADAVAAPGKRGWELWLHETSPGVGVVKVWHAERPTAVVTVPLTSIKSYEEFWSEPRYKDLLAREAAAKADKKTKADAAAEAEKAAAKK